MPRSGADGLLVATVSADGTGGVWNSKKEEWADESIKHNSGILAVTFSKDGNWVASAGDDNTVSRLGYSSRQSANAAAATCRHGGQGGIQSRWPLAVDGQR